MKIRPAFRSSFFGHEITRERAIRLGRELFFPEIARDNPSGWKEVLRGNRDRARLLGAKSRLRKRRVGNSVEASVVLSTCA
jgi:hypothetical protein